MLKVSWVKNVARQFGRTFLKCKKSNGNLTYSTKGTTRRSLRCLALLIACVLAALRRRKVESILNLKPAQNRDLVLIAEHYKTYKM